MNNKNVKSSQIPEEKLQDIQVKKNGQEICSKGLVVINGLEFGWAANGENHGKGILGFDIIVRGDEKPKVIVHYHSHLISKEIVEILGLTHNQLHSERGENMNKSKGNEKQQSIEELLRQQLQLLAERSEKANSCDLPHITLAMVEIFKILKD
ncbi:hypothetical protein [Metasolibacillus sp.]|uniref:hypothetical protein n=1 Tax=Metasolibacillus sp. TaxID=2703680 RepID=UPI0025D4A7C3|nr:hypothetical protein [Metasolibacillus sp.]MCT6925274.1 hypothetical protein [Metasolibacillus sp.]MCT6941496.1 hypothetical protein [Metasolibacillus sp.]